MIFISFCFFIWLSHKILSSMLWVLFPFVAVFGSKYTCTYCDILWTEKRSCQPVYLSVCLHICFSCPVFRNFQNMKHSKLFQRVSFAMLELNRPNYFDCSKVSKLPFLPFLPLFYLEVIQPTRKIRPYSSSATSNEYESPFCFQF